MDEARLRRYHSLSDAERLLRPTHVEPLDFGDLARPGPRFRNTAYLIPIESARPGDRQVFAGCGPLPGEPVVALDPLADLPSVQSIVATTRIRAQRSLPAIRELLLFGRTPVPDGDTLGHMAGLERLWAAWAPRARTLAVERLPAGLDALGAARHVLPAPPEGGPRFAELLRFERLRALWLVDCWPADSVAPLAGLTGLVRLHADARSGWSRLRSLTALEHVEAIRPRLANLRAFSRWTRLVHLTLTGGGVGSLSGAEAFQQLQSLSCAMIAADDLAPLAGLPRLQDVRLVGLTRVSKLDALGALPALRRLVVSRAGHEFRDIQHVPSLAPLASATALEELELEGVVIDDGDLGPLAGLPRLRRVRVYGDLDAAVERLRRTRPGIEISGHGAARPPGELVDGVYLRPPARGLPQWWMREDLTARLRVPTNAAAEERLRAALEADAPDLLPRLEFDTEAEAVVVLAAAERDLRAVAAMVARLAADPAQRRI